MGKQKKVQKQVPGMRLNPATANILLILFSILFALLAAEVMLQIINKPGPGSSGWKSHGVSKLELNQLGFRGQPIEYSDDDFVVVLLGDSQVEASQCCAYGWRPENRLQHHLSAGEKRVKVFSLGSGGYGQDQQLLVLREYYQKHRADLVVLWQTPENDPWNNMFPTHWPADGTPKPTYWLENGELRGPDMEMGARLSSKIKLVALWERFVVPVSRDKQFEKYFPPAYAPMREYEGPVEQDWQKRWDNNIGLMRNENLANEKSHLAIRLSPRSERTQYGLDLTRKLLHEIERLVVNHAGTFVMFRVDKPLEHQDSGGRVHVLNGNYYKTSSEQFLSNINYLNQDFKNHTVRVRIKDWAVGPEDGHINERATDQAMKDLSRKLEPLVPNQTGRRQNKTH